MTPEELGRTEEAALIANVLLVKATLLFEEASRPGANEQAHQDYLEAQTDYECFMRGWGVATDRGLLAQAAEASHVAGLSNGAEDKAAAERGWNRYLDFRSVHREEIRMNDGRSR